MKLEKISRKQLFYTLEDAETAGESTMGHNRHTRDAVFMAAACCVAMRSPDPRRQVGCMAVKEDGTPIAFSYNGLVPGADDIGFDWDNRPLVRKIVRHAEYNLVQFATSLVNATVYSTLQPCKDCEDMLRQAGVKRVVYKESYYECDRVAQLDSLSPSNSE